MPLASAPWFPLRHAVISLRRPGNQTRVILLAVGLGSFFVLGVRTLQSDNTVNDALFAASTLSHQTAINANVADTDKIEAVDPTEVAAKLQAVELQLQASFGAYAQVARLSLVNFIA